MKLLAPGLSYHDAQQFPSFWIAFSHLLDAMDTKQKSEDNDKDEDKDSRRQPDKKQKENGIENLMN